MVVGPQGNETRDALTVGFQKKYPEIRVEHSGSAGAQPWSYKNDAGEVRHVAVLGVSPINSAYDAVRAYIVSESQKQSKPS